MANWFQWLFFAVLLQTAWKCGLSDSVPQKGTAFWLFPPTQDSLTMGIWDVLNMEWSSNYTSAETFFLLVGCIPDAGSGTPPVSDSIPIPSSGEFPFNFRTTFANDTIFPYFCWAEIYVYEGAGANSNNESKTITFTITSDNGPSKTFALNQSLKFPAATSVVTETTASSTTALQTSTTTSQANTTTLQASTTTSQASKTTSQTRTTSQASITTTAPAIITTNTNSNSSANITWKKSRNLAAIISGSIGGAAFLFLTAFVVLILKKHQTQENNGEESRPRRELSRWWEYIQMKLQFKTSVADSQMKAPKEGYVEKHGNPIFELPVGGDGGE